MLRRRLPFEQSLHCKFNKAWYCSLEHEPTPVTDSTTKITVGAVGNYPALNRNSSLLTLRRLMSYIYIYMEHPFLMFLDHTQRRSTVGRTPLDE